MLTNRHIHRIYFACLAVIACLVASCTKNEANVRFDLQSDLNANYLLLYYVSESNHEELREDVAVVQNGTYEFKAPCENPSLIYFFEGSRRLPVVAYMERGNTITIQGSSNAAAWKIGGNEINELLTSFRTKNLKTIEHDDRKALNKGVAAFVKEHPESGASTIIILIYYDRSIDPVGFEQCWKRLVGDATESRWRELISRSDMLNGYEPLSRDVKDIVLKTAYNGVDTIRTDSVPAIFYFNFLSAESRNNDIKILRTLLKERKDSASRMIVEISLETDSSTWAYRLPRDTLKGAVRAWMPKSFSDSLANVFGLTSQPLFVVTRKGGVIIYHGNDAEKAANKFREASK